MQEQIEYVVQDGKTSNTTNCNHNLHEPALIEPKR